MNQETLQENSADLAMEQAVTQMFENQDTPTQESKEESAEVEEINTEAEDDNIEPQETVGANNDEQEITDVEESDLDKELSGHVKEFKDLVKSVEDPELREKLINAGKKSRADLDRKRLELGESKKIIDVLEDAIQANNLGYSKQQYAQMVKNYADFEALTARDPRQAIELLAKQTNVDLTNFGKSTVSESEIDDEDYRTPEEIRLSNELSDIRNKLESFEQQKQKEQQISAKKEIENFSQAKDANGNLKHPYFDRVRHNMALFFNDSNPDMTMEKAYQKAVLLDDELASVREEEILRKAEAKRQAEIQKAKKLKKQSSKGSSVKASTTDPEAATEAFIRSLYS